MQDVWRIKRKSQYMLKKDHVNFMPENLFSVI